ncbi:YlbE-like family protein [Niallia taxi]|uniref:YlbE-like protein n=1 Tax=Niallia taxi TaxID=2499688 RepID=A0A3S2W6K8_9BACI|nr:YlbE-like family protein [Niallia taxi]MCM3214865.1 YlbE-like family protein [Niallia taxi]MDK8638766.1 YlbE-like family protein [Niallia taxi]MED4037695.1 YlbE-like family protein [Niallia taxi]MED4053612.1 YlbE-like family protein [Niallia taxi]MED4119452.1 YlbE-like family protein [Niallia taxi]
MRKNVKEYIEQNRELQQFIREQPLWYRQLCRNPSELQSFEIASMHYYKKTIPHRVEKFSNGVQMASMMFSMFQAMNAQS